MHTPFAGKTLITGATGFAGGHLARTLLSRGESVRILVRPAADPGELVGLGAEVSTGVVENAADVRRAVEGADRIFHLAAVFRTAGHPDSYYHDVNVGGTENILAAARRCGVARTIHTSTIGIHGDVREIPCTEDAPVNPGDIYQRTKLLGERAALAAFRGSLPGVVIRPASNYGPRDLRLLKLFRTVQRGTFRMFGSGDTLFHGIYIDDLIEGMLLCARRDEALGEVFILAGEQHTTLNELVALIADAVGARPPRTHLPLWPLIAAGAACETLCRPLGIEPPLHRRRVHFFTKNRAFSTEKSRRLLGFDPRVGIAEGVARTAAWYAEHGHLAATGPRASHAQHGVSPAHAHTPRQKGKVHDPDRATLRA